MCTMHCSKVINTLNRIRSEVCYEYCSIIKRPHIRWNVSIDSELKYCSKFKNKIKKKINFLLLKMFSLPRVAKVFNISSRKCLQQMARKASILAAAKTSPDNRYMIVDVNNNDDVSKNTQLKYPLIWLRDNCQCSKCFDAQTKSRTLDWTKFKFENAQPKSISVSGFEMTI